MPADTPTKLKGYPTKDLFISTLVRDIPLSRAILDLVDNCVDGARRLRPAGDYKGLWIDLQISKENFQIADNCGGIPLDLAENYAFRFGRPPGMTQTPHSVGQFGVGMKRALFKLGTEFSVESKSENSVFKMPLKVDDWKKQVDDAGNDDWTFPLEHAEYLIQAPPTAERGTKIVVSVLHPPVSNEFALSNFITRLFDEIGSTQRFSIQRNLQIRLNGTQVPSKPLQLASSRAIRPAYLSLSINGTMPPVAVKLYAGVTNEDRTEFSDAGWYVFCNERLVLAADQSPMTGWEQAKFHPRFNRFRGYVFFDCDDASRLPWNTTKTGVDTNSPTYQAVRLSMVSAMTPRLNFPKRVSQGSPRR